jgi:hypothetical protein
MFTRAVGWQQLIPSQPSVNKPGFDRKHGHKKHKELKTRKFMIFPQRKRLTSRVTIRGVVHSLFSPPRSPRTPRFNGRFQEGLAGYPFPLRDPSGPALPVF